MTAGRVCLLRQYRYVADGWLWELPAGKLEPNEPPLVTAQRELIEEAGVSAANWRSLGVCLSSPGVFSERLHLYLASGLQPPATAAHERAEVIEVHWVPFAQACAWALDGTIADCKTAHRPAARAQYVADERLKVCGNSVTALSEVRHTSRLGFGPSGNGDAVRTARTYSMEDFRKRRAPAPSPQEANRRRLGRVVHDERGNAFVTWHDAPADEQRHVLEILGDPKLKVKTDESYDPYARRRGAHRRRARQAQPSPRTCASSASGSR